MSHSVYFTGPLYERMAEDLHLGGSVKAIQKYMGHSSLQTTMIYLHLTETAEVDARQKIEQLFPTPTMNWRSPG